MLYTIVVFAAVLAIIVLFHEFGHFITAKMFGAKTEEFGFGFPPPICGWKKKNGKRKFSWGNKDVEKMESEDTVFSVNWIPLGGFVKIKGEDGENKKENDSFAAKKIWQRCIILSAGVIMNVVLAMVALSIAFMIGAPQVLDSTEGAKVKNQQIQITSVIENSPAAEAGIKPGDAIKKIDQQPITGIVQIQEYVSAKQGSELIVEVKRLNEQKTFAVTPEFLEQTKKPSLGVGLANTGVVSYPWYQAIWMGVRAAIVMLWQIIVAFGTLIKNAIVGAGIGVEVAGPVGIAVMTGQVARMGLGYVLQFIALLSLNLALINFLPFPALDGGRVLFLLIEKIKGSPVSQKIEQTIHATGFLLLILLMIIVTGRDLFQFKDFFISLWHKIGF